MFQSLHHFHGTLLDSLQHAWRAQSWMQHYNCWIHQCWRISSLSLLPVSNAAQQVVVCLCSQRHISEPWSTWCPWGSPDPSLQCCFQACSSLSWCLGLFLTRYKTLHFPLLNVMTFLSVQFSSLSRSLWTATHLTIKKTTCPSFVSSANLWRVHFLQTSS